MNIRYPIYEGVYRILTNGQACRFYQHMGFQVAGRDETDPMGKPFPILHLQLPTPPQITQIEHRL